MKREDAEKLLFGIGIELPFLREELSEIGIAISGDSPLSSTDGITMIMPEKGEVNEESFLHTFIHLIWSHPSLKMKTDDVIRDIACDMACEYIRSEVFPYSSGGALRRRIRDIAGEAADPRDPESLAEALMDMYPEDIELIRDEFRLDGHSFWGRTLPGLTEKKKKAVREAVGSMEEKLSSGRGDRGDTGQLPGNRFEKALLREKGRHDLRRYLKRFADTGEEKALDTDSFDYIPYTYGMEHYGSMPFIEPLEYRESSKVREMAVAIDTSGSCSVEIISFFLSEIEHMLMDSDSFFDRMNIHMIQCDARVRDHTVIRSREEWKRYRKDLTLKGRGGTDFRPVFDLLSELYPASRDISSPVNGRRHVLKGVLYFTDGKGIYPEKEPPWDTAFVLPGPGGLKAGAPSWARLLVLGKRQEDGSKGRAQ